MKPAGDDGGPVRQPLLPSFHDRVSANDTGTVGGVARTTDHSLVQQMVAGGMLDEEGARLHPQRNMLLSALGSIEEEPEIAVSERMRLLPGDVLLLCSDGVWEPLGDECLIDTLHASRTPSQWTELIDAQVKANAKPGHDNYTALTLWVIEDDEDDVTRLMPENAMPTDS